jgi:copper(I)-binding protein
MVRFHVIGLATLSALVAIPTVAQEFKAGDITINRPWSRATPKGAEVAGCLIIHKNGASPDTLLGGSADFAGNLENS